MLEAGGQVAQAQSRASSAARRASSVIVSSLSPSMLRRVEKLQRWSCGCLSNETAEALLRNRWALFYCIQLLSLGLMSLSLGFYLLLLDRTFLSGMMPHAAPRLLVSVAFFVLAPGLGGFVVACRTNLSCGLPRMLLFTFWPTLLAFSLSAGSVGVAPSHYGDLGAGAGLTG